MASADTLELKDGSQIKGKFLGGTETETSFQVGSTVQKHNVADIVSLKFDSEGVADAPAPQPQNSLPDNPNPVATVEMKPAYVTIPAGTRVSVRTIDAIDSTRRLPGDRFQASLAEPLMLAGKVVVAKDALVYGRLTESKESGTFTGKSQLRLELAGIVVNGKTFPVVNMKRPPSRAARAPRRELSAERLLERYRRRCRRRPGSSDRRGCRRRLGNHHYERPGKGAE